MFFYYLYLNQVQCNLICLSPANATESTSSFDLEIHLYECSLYIVSTPDVFPAGSFPTVSQTNHSYNPVALSQIWLYANKSHENDDPFPISETYYNTTLGRNVVKVTVNKTATGQLSLSFVTSSHMPSLVVSLFFHFSLPDCLSAEVVAQCTAFLYIPNNHLVHLRSLSIEIVTYRTPDSDEGTIRTSPWIDDLYSLFVYQTVSGQLGREKGGCSCKKFPRDPDSCSLLCILSFSCFLTLCLLVFCLFCLISVCPYPVQR